ncbi:MAG: hypothetical protein MUF81_16935 [Verrucomicrobia bacterium]|nr:hypothetical protein [Verrucomicrobiota bacterium]
MSEKRASFPMDVPSGSVTVKIYKVRNQACRKKSKTGRVVEAKRFGYTVSYFAGTKRCWKMFVDFDEACREAKSRADSASNVFGRTVVINRATVPVFRCARQ